MALGETDSSAGKVGWDSPRFHRITDLTHILTAGYHADRSCTGSQGLVRTLASHLSLK